MQQSPTFPRTHLTRIARRLKLRERQRSTSDFNFGSRNRNHRPASRGVLRRSVRGTAPPPALFDWPPAASARETEHPLDHASARETVDPGPDRPSLSHCCSRMDAPPLSRRTAGRHRQSRYMPRSVSRRDVAVQQRHICIEVQVTCRATRHELRGF